MPSPGLEPMALGLSVKRDQMLVRLGLGLCELIFTINVDKARIRLYVGHSKSNA